MDAALTYSSFIAGHISRNPPYSMGTDRVGHSLTYGFGAGPATRSFTVTGRWSL